MHISHFLTETKQLKDDDQSSWWPEEELVALHVAKTLDPKLHGLLHKVCGIYVHATAHKEHTHAIGQLAVWLPDFPAEM